MTTDLAPILAGDVRAGARLMRDLDDRRPAALAALKALFPHTGPRVVYGETTRLGEARLREAGITFKQIPYDIKAR